jgi:hypothetical protein
MVEAEQHVAVPPELQELIRCAQNKTLKVYAGSWRRNKVLTGLIRAGDMIPVNKKGVSGWNPALLSALDYHQAVTLTNQGRDRLLALDPADFWAARWWPLPDDIRAAQAAIRDVDF